LGRSTIAVSDETASLLSRIANNEDKTAYALANECLNAALRVCENGGAPSEIYGAWVMNRIGKDIGALQWVGRNLLEQFVNTLDPVDKEKCFRTWFGAGENFGIYLQICFPEINDVVSLCSQLKKSFTIGRVEFSQKLLDEGEIDGQYMGSTYGLTIVCAYSGKFLALLSEYWRGILWSYGLKEVESSIGEGAINLRFLSQGKLAKANPQLVR
jgi:hypothetical protein